MFLAFWNPPHPADQSHGPRRHKGWLSIHQYEPYVFIFILLIICNLTNSYKYLRVELTPTLNPSSHFYKSMKKANGRLKLLRKIRKSITDKAAEAIYQSLILPTLTSSSLLHLNPCQSHIDLMSCFHDKCLRIVSSNDTTTDHILSPYKMMKFKCCTLVYKSLNNETCEQGT